MTVTLSHEPRTYIFHFATDAGEATCVVKVPLRVASAECDESNVVRWTPKDETSETVADFYLLNSVRAEVSVVVDETQVYTDSVDAAGGRQTEQLGSRNFCSGPCFTVRESLDLSGLQLP